MRVLFIVYYLDPAISVGAHRLTYWAKNLARMGEDISVEVITAINGEEELSGVNKVHVVPNGKPGSTIGIADEGFTWKAHLLEYIEQMDFNFDWIIMSGGPFMHFGITKHLKAEYGTRVLLDFRDPFARNPRFDNSYLKIAIKSYYEKQFIKSADQIVTVNDLCVDLLRYRGVDNYKYAIIENGYDDTVLDEVQSTVGEKAGIRLIYSGTFFDDRNPSTFVKILSEDEFSSAFEFIHLGKPSSHLEPFKDKTNINELGLKPYAEMLQDVANADVGLIFTSGNAFESTTKIFDYIGLKKAILIVTDGSVKTGNLHRITRSYPKVYWCKNNSESIRQILNEMSNADLNVSYPERETHSRHAGLKKLAALLNIDTQ
ncbi:MAG: glycosyltransferase [Flavobacteriales bacterium]|nr:glycosyltransferase [Flavobacteriales bacterium]